nr:MAG TPA: hypothetical protein [Caudoviricetes sp.]
MVSGLWVEIPAGLIFLPFFVIHRNYLGKRRLGR